jgi:phosphoribosyl 1,2-cyclic phosphodiesterase
MLRFASLGSGSEGNALVVESGNTRVMLDCGFGPKEAARRLERLGVEPSSVAAVIVTHEHSDHLGGAAKFCGHYGARLVLSYGTFWAALEAFPKAFDEIKVTCIDSTEITAIGDIEFTPYPVPHDARQPIQAVFSDGDVRLGVLTDVGETTPTIHAALSGCDGLVLEANHDEDMLARGNYPASLKRRIAGRYGHLSNAASAALLASLDCANLQHLIAAHLSQQNNTPEHARAAFAHAMNCTKDWIGVACQSAGFDWRELRAS